MSIVEDLRKLLQDLVAPELRALGQKLDSQNEVMRSRFDAAEKITKVLDDRQIDRVQQLETKMIDRFQHVDTKMIGGFQQLDMKITMNNELTQRDLKSIQTSVSSLANTVERLLSERRHQPAPVPGTVIARRLEETSSPSEAPRPATTAED